MVTKSVHHFLRITSGHIHKNLFLVNEYDTKKMSIIINIITDIAI